jgi:hypothetical protein
LRGRKSGQEMPSGFHRFLFGSLKNDYLRANLLPYQQAGMSHLSGWRTSICRIDKKRIAAKEYFLTVN